MSWKTYGIVITILFISVLAFVGYSYSLGIDIEEKSNECAYNVCSAYNSYYYDDWEQVCYCFADDGEIAKERYLE